MSITYIEIDPTCIIYPRIRDGVLLGGLDFSDERGEGGGRQGSGPDNWVSRKSSPGVVFEVEPLGPCLCTVDLHLHRPDVPGRTWE